ncbi:hypothetical protein BX257_1381 [Streptomyces sp. 3212.3]|nr:hypothetical protein BX257_1381 [Streptomyces sp. 3212.3]
MGARQCHWRAPHPQNLYEPETCHPSHPLHRGALLAGQHGVDFWTEPAHPFTLIISGWSIWPRQFETKANRWAANTSG